MAKAKEKGPKEEAAPVTPEPMELPERVAERATPRAIILTNMPGGYSKTAHQAAIRSLISRNGQFIYDTASKKQHEHGGLYSLVNATRELLQRADRVERRGKMDQSFTIQGAATPTTEKVVTVRDVAGVIEGLMMNTLVDVSQLKHLFLGYDPDNELDRKHFNEIFSEVIAERVFQKPEIKRELEGITDPNDRKKREDEIREKIMGGKAFKTEIGEVKEEWGNRKIIGIMHRWTRREPQLKNDFRGVTVADAAALRMWAHESALLNDMEGASGELDKVMIPALAKSFAETFHFINEGGQAVSIGKIMNQLKHQYGLAFDPILTEHIGWMARDMAIRTDGYYRQVTKRVPRRWWWDSNAREMGVEDEKAQEEADNKLKQTYRAHGDMLTEVEGRGDLGVYGRAMAIALHKGADDVDIQKGNVLGKGNPQWKFDRFGFLCNESFYHLRDHVSERPNFENETEYQRQIADRLWDRLDNVVTRDDRGNITNGAIEYRDAYVQDFVTEGSPTLQASTLAYVKRTWGRDDEAGQGTKIRGYDMLIKDIWGAEEIKDKDELGQRVLAAVNRSKTEKLRHVDEINKADVTDEVVDASDLSRDELTNRLAKSRLMRDIKRGSYIYLEAYFRKLRARDTPDMDLRWRTIVRDAPLESTATQHLHYIMTQMARDPDDTVRIDDREATESEALKISGYAFALRDLPELVGRVFCSERWREIASPDFADPKLEKERLQSFQDYLMENKELGPIAALVGRSEIESKALLQALLNIEKRFVDRHAEAVSIAVRQSPETEDVVLAGRPFAYNKSLIEEALKISAPPSTPEGLDVYFGNIRLAQLLTKYGGRLRAIREPLEHPYAPRAQELLGNQMANEREQLLTELSNDLFKSKEFGSIGSAFSEESFREFFAKHGLDVSKEGALENFTTLQFYIFLQQVDARYRGFGEQLYDTNTYGTAGLTPQKVDAGDLIDFMSTSTGDGDFEIRLDELSESEANERVVSPRSRRPGYTNTVVMRGVSATGAWANQQKGIRILTEEPYTRYMMLNLARNQAACREFHRIRSEDEETLDTARIERILRDNNVDRSHQAFVEVRRGGDADINQIGDMLKNVHENALRATANRLGVVNPNLVDFGKWINEYGNSLFEQSQGNMDGAIEHLNEALGYADRFNYARNAKDLRVVTLNKRGWVRHQKIESLRDASKPELRSETQLAVDDFTAAWLRSRGEDPALALNQARGPFRNIVYWYQQRFSNRSKRPVRGEDPEAVTGMGLSNSKISNLSYISGEDTRRRYFGTAAVAAAATAAAAVTAPIAAVPALAVAGASVGLVWLTERLGVGEYWANRAQQILAATPRPSGTDTEARYIRAYKARKVASGSARTHINSGDRSWFGFLRGAWWSFNWDSLGLGGGLEGLVGYDDAVRVLDPVTRRHILHVSTASMDKGQEPILMEDMYADTYEVRELKRDALRKGGRYYESIPSMLESDSIPPEDLPETARLADIVERNRNIKPGIWGRLFGLFPRINPLSNYWGRRWWASNLMKHITDPAHRGELNALGASLNREMGTTFGRLADEEPNPRLRKGYKDLSRTSLETAVAKYRDGFQEDNSIPTSDAKRGLIWDTRLRMEGRRETGVTLR